jgi:putative hemolysin
MSLINKEEFSKATKLNQLGLDRLLASPLMKFLKIDDVNKLYDAVSKYEGVEFVREALQYLGVHFEVNQQELSNIPKSGAFITVSNHPYGGLDGLILMQLIGEQRPDFKVMGNFLLQNIVNIKDIILPVNPFDKLVSDKSSLKGIKLTMEALQNGNGVGIFPSGEVSAWQIESRRVRDTEWKPTVGKIIQKAAVPVVPVYFSGSNSYLFNILGLINPNFRTIQLPTELMRKKKEPILVRIGKPVKPKNIAEFEDHAQLLRYLRAKTYALGSALEVKKSVFFNPIKLVNKKAEKEKVIDTVDKQLIEQEVDKLREKGESLFKQEEFEVFVSYSTSIPNILREIGRLREITFRDVGEGTGKSIDLDEFDLYYHHLFIWDTEKKAIVGAYRVGLGNEIYTKFRKKGFYVNTLFKIKNEFVPILKKSMEMGRSFIAKEYQQRILSLFLLWKGILFYIRKNKDYRYLIGPVSISNNFSNVSKALMIDFITKNHYNETLAKCVEPRNRFKYQINNEEIDHDLLFKNQKNDIKILDDVIADIEPTHLRIPILVKKYFSLDAKIIAFNIDPLFENSLDGFVVLDTHTIPEKMIEMLDK